MSLSFLRFQASSFESSRELGREFFVLFLCSVGIQFLDRVLGNFGVPRQIVGRQDGLHVARLVAGDGINFDLVASCSRQRHDGGSAQIVKRQAAYARSQGRLTPGALKPALTPRPPDTVGQDERAAPRCRV